jgi:hypothetical protein
VCPSKHQVGSAPINAVVFASYAQMQRFLDTVSPRPHGVQSTYRDLGLCALWAGLVQTVVATPVELIKCKMQMQGLGDRPSYTGPIDCIRKVSAPGFPSFPDCFAIYCTRVHVFANPTPCTVILPCCRWCKLTVFGSACSVASSLRLGEMYLDTYVGWDAPSRLQRNISTESENLAVLQAFYFLGYEWTKRTLSSVLQTEESNTGVLLAAGAVAGILGVRTQLVSVCCTFCLAYPTLFAHSTPSRVSALFRFGVLCSGVSHTRLTS